MNLKQAGVAALLALATFVTAAQGPAPQGPKPVEVAPKGAKVPVTAARKSQPPAPSAQAAAADAAAAAPNGQTIMAQNAPAATLANGAHELTAADVDAWLDGYMPYAMATGDIAGSVVVVVKDGQIVTERGFGYADIAKKKPVDPKLTLFRPGSTSKLFTWTAVMQLVEQGKLDLDADVNKYLPADFQIPPREGSKPVTLRNIMQHTAGFEEQIKNLITEDPKAAPFDVLLKQWMPTRIFDAGTTPAYSNYATSMAGYIVQRVSGEPFDEYIEKHIFAPLDMTHSTFRQPLPENLAPLMSTGYNVASGDPKKFEIVGPAPAGALSSSGEDMAHFMIAHLQDGEYHGNRILEAKTAEQMHNSPLTLLPPMNRMELGFFETNINGREVIAHLGDTVYFHTSLHLFLKENTGFYVSFNSGGKEGASHHLRLALFADFADRYFPAPPHEKKSIDEATAKQHAQLLAGYWMPSRRVQTTFLSAINLIGQDKVSVGPKGELIVAGANDLNGKPIKWVETSPFVWQDPNGHDQLAAKVVDGRVTRFSYGLLGPFEVYLRPSPARDAGWLLPAMIASLIALALTVIFWPITAIVRRRYRSRLDLAQPALRAYRAGKLGALLVLLAFGAWGTSIVSMFGDLNRTTAAFDPILRFDQIFGFIGFIGGLLLVLWNLRVVWTGQRRWPAKLWSVVLVLSALVMLWIAAVFHLISWGVNY